LGRTGLSFGEGDRIGFEGIKELESSQFVVLDSEISMRFSIASFSSRDNLLLFEATFIAYFRGLLCEIWNES
jgi:hypothetical protein